MGQKVADLEEYLDSAEREMVELRKKLEEKKDVVNDSDLITLHQEQIQELCQDFEREKIEQQTAFENQLKELKEKYESEISMRRDFYI